MTNDASERHWAGSKTEWLQSDYVVSRMQSSDGKMWLEDSEGLRLDPNYSDYSVRIWHPGSRSLSFVLRTVAILPKSLLKRIYNLIGGYLETIKEQTETYQPGDRCCNKGTAIGDLCRACAEEGETCCMVDGGGCPTCIGSCDGDIPEDAQDDQESCGTCHRWELGYCDTDAGEWCEDWVSDLEC